MHEEFCPICGAQSWSYLYKSRESREVVGCDICLMALDEIDAYEEGLFDEGIKDRDRWYPGEQQQIHGQ